MNSKRINKGRKLRRKLKIYTKHRYCIPEDLLYYKYLKNLINKAKDFLHS